MVKDIGMKLDTSKPQHSSEAVKTEKKWQEHWNKEKVYSFDANSKGPVYSLDTPPPTVSGRMHLGHAFSYTQADFIARYKRMKGFNVFYPFGLDDNGLATILLVEKSLGIQSKNFSREEFIKICLKETQKAEQLLYDDFGSLGLSVDWALVYRTIDDWCRKTSQRSFIELFKKGRAYQREAPTMWCPKCEVSIAQAELEDLEEDSVFAFIKFDVVGGGEITIATTRPELMHACIAIHVHPDDKRYKKFIGKEAKIPFTERTVKIYANKDVDKEFGTGAVYHCTYGDLDDVEWILEYNLPAIEILGRDGRFNEKAGALKGMKAKEARKKIIEELKNSGNLVKVEPIKHTVNAHERCKTPIEILTVKQWFIKYLDLKKELVERANEIGWHPKHMKVRYDNWVNGLKWDWSISRQRHFGVPFPLWYCKKCGEVKAAEDKQLPVDPIAAKPLTQCHCGSREFEAERDVMDTWATSSLTPQIVSKWKQDEKFFGRLFPMGLRPQAHDIINLWAFYTIAKGLLHENKMPWKNIMISGHALDPKGRKMSKSLGNAVDPIATIEKYSADILRYWSGASTLGEDLPFQEKELVAGQKFITKLNNAARFVSLQAKGIDLEKVKESELKFRAPDKWVLSRLNSVKKEATEALEKYEFSKALNPVRNFFWLEFADYYLEEVKWRVYDEKNESCKAAKFVLAKVLLDVLKLLAPFLPHITEEIYNSPMKQFASKKSIHLEQWPEAEEKWIDSAAEEKGAMLNEVVAALRKWKTEKGFALNKELMEVQLFAEKGKEKALEEIAEDAAKTMNVKELKVSAGKAPKEAIDVGTGVKALVSG
ncbi:MAG: valine--tRNA ligase [Candidatus Diapherotrites archaeon]